MRRLPEVGETLVLAKAGSTLTVGRRLQEGGQGVVYEASVGEGVFALKWLRHSQRTTALHSSIEALTERPRPHPAFVWPIDTVRSDDIEGFGYIMRLMEPRFISFARMLQDQPSFRTIVAVARRLVEAFGALHASGLCYRDISFANLYVDPIRIEVAIIDNDNVGLDGGEIFVRGTNQFMAPEIVRGEALPSTVTDLYSLAVFLFILFMRGQPLEGVRAMSSYSWRETNQLNEDQLLLRHYGEAPLFVFDPEDTSNRPPPESPLLIYWPIFPRFFRELFVRSFTEGLVNATLSGRVTGSVWRRALARLADTHATCSCNAAIFFDPEEPDRACWNCGKVPPRQPLLELPGRKVVLSEGTVITSDHLGRDRLGPETIAVVEAHPDRPGMVILRNLSERTWSVEPDGEEKKVVAPSQRLAVRPMRVDFGVADGRIALGV